MRNLITIFLICNSITKSENYNLPTDRIASKPLDIRSESKLMNYKIINGTHSDNKFSDIFKILKKGDLLIMNNTKVIPARMHLNKETGGKIEILFDRLLEKNNFSISYGYLTHHVLPGTHQFNFGMHY